MAMKPATSPADQAQARKARRKEAMHLQRMEGNPFDAEDNALFEMFERKGWSHEQRRAYIIAQAKGLTVSEAAE